MHAICGVFRTDGGAVEARHLEAMGAAAPVPRKGPVRTWIERGIGLAWLGEPARFAPGDGPAVVAEARLLDTAGLTRALDPPGSGGAPRDVLDLIRLAYERWGEAFPAHLLGDFAIAVVDRRRARLLLARDPFGARPLVVHRRAGLVVFGTWIHAVRAHPEVPRRIHEARVADYFIDELEALDVTSTFYEDIERHLPAHVLTVEADAARTTRYWRLAPEPSPPGPDAKERVAGLRAVLAQAVADRLDARPGTGVMLSGGVDSIAIACLGREALAAAGGAPLPTFSGVLADAQADTEGPQARAVVAQGGLDAHWFVPGDMARHGAAIRRVLDVTEDPFDVAMLELRVLMYLEAAARGVPVLLDGVDGNLVLSHDAEAIGFLLRQGRWRAAWRVAGGLSRFYATSRAGLLWHYGVRTLRPEAVARLRRRLVGSTAHEDLLRRSLVSPALAARTSLRARVERRFHVDPETAWALRHDPHAYHLRNLQAPMIPAALERYARAAAYQGLEASHPFLDRRVVEVGLGLPWELKIEGGWPKSALRRALEGTAPNGVLWRPAAHNLSTAFWRQTLVQSEDLLADLERPAFREARGMADGKRVGEALVRWREAGCVISGVRALRVAALACWLERSA